MPGCSKIRQWDHLAVSFPQELQHIQVQLRVQCHLQRTTTTWRSRATLVPGSCGPEILHVWVQQPQGSIQAAHARCSRTIQPARPCRRISLVSLRARTNCRCFSCIKHEQLHVARFIFPRRMQGTDTTLYAPTNGDLGSPLTMWFALPAPPIQLLALRFKAHHCQPAVDPP